MEYEIEESINPHPWQHDLADADAPPAPLLGWKPVLQNRALPMPEGDDA